jgi:hypothetical protein
VTAEAWIIPVVTLREPMAVAQEPAEVVTSPVRAGRRAQAAVPVRLAASVPLKKYPGETLLSFVQVMFGTLNVQSFARVKPPKAPALLYWIWPLVSRPAFRRRLSASGTKGQNPPRCSSGRRRGRRADQVGRRGPCADGDAVRCERC